MLCSLPNTPRTELSHRRGWFAVAAPLVRDAGPGISALFDGAIVVETLYDAAKDHTRYIAFHPAFDTLEDDIVAPHYTAVVTVTGHTLISVEWSRVD